MARNKIRHKQIKCSVAFLISSPNTFKERAGHQRHRQPRRRGEKGNCSLDPDLLSALVSRAEMSQIIRRRRLQQSSTHHPPKHGTCSVTSAPLCFLTGHSKCIPGFRNGIWESKVKITERSRGISVREGERKSARKGLRTGLPASSVWP